MTPSPGRAWRSFILSPVLLAALAAPYAVAARPFFAGQPPDSQGLVRPQSLVESQKLADPSGISMEQAAASVQRQTGGRVLSTTPAQRGGGAGYDVRVLIDGKRVKNVFVDERGNVRAQP